MHQPEQGDTDGNVYQFKPADPPLRPHEPARNRQAVGPLRQRCHLVHPVQRRLSVIQIGESHQDESGREHPRSMRAAGRHSSRRGARVDNSPMQTAMAMPNKSPWVCSMTLCQLVCKPVRMFSSFRSCPQPEADAADESRDQSCKCRTVEVVPPAVDQQTGGKADTPGPSCRPGAGSSGA